VSRAAADELTPSAFVILALLAEGPAHGYQIREVVHTRGFRFWVNMGRSSIYAILGKLQKAGLVDVRLESGGGPTRKVFSLTASGEERCQREAIAYLSRPAHPRNNIDLGIYALSMLPPKQATDALEESLSFLGQRRAFLEERLDWCRARDLWLPALAFERPLLELAAEIEWLQRVLGELRRHPDRIEGPNWASYEYLEPPNADDA